MQGQIQDIVRGGGGGSRTPRNCLQGGGVGGESISLASRLYSLLTGGGGGGEGRGGYQRTIQRQL